MASLCAWLKYSGARKVDGTVVASGRAWFYQPGTVSTQVTAYSDADGLVAITQPLTLDAAGRGTAYLKVASRIEVQEAVTFTQIAISDRANTVNAKQVEIENATVIGTDLVGGGQVLGGRTDLDTQITAMAASTGGSSFNYKESSTATARTLQAAIGGGEITFQDFGALGDDSADDTTAIQAAIARALVSNKAIRVEPGTYRITAALTANAATAAGLIIRGVNRADCKIKNMGTSTAALSVDLGSAIESHVVLENFSIITNTTSSAAAIVVVNGDGPILRNLYITGHRIGIDTSAVVYSEVEDVLVASTDSNAAGKGFRLGANATAYKCRAVQTNGKGFSFEGTYGRAISCRAAVTSGTGYDLASSFTTTFQSISAGSTTGFSFTASDTAALSCYVTSSTNAFSVGAVARAGCVACLSTAAATADFVTDASATEVADAGNKFTTRSHGEYAGNQLLGIRQTVIARSRTTSASAGGVNYTPDPRLGQLQVYVSTASSNVALAVQSTGTAGLIDGQVMTLVIENIASSGSPTVTPSYTTQYKGGVTSAIAVNFYRVDTFVWRAAASTWISTGNSGAIANVGAGLW